MNNQQILENAPENATTFAKQGYFDKFDCLLKCDGTWQISDIEPTNPRSLADIRRIVVLENAIAEAKRIAEYPPQDKTILKVLESVNE